MKLYQTTSALLFESRYISNNKMIWSNNDFQGFRATIYHVQLLFLAEVNMLEAVSCIGYKPRKMDNLSFIQKMLFEDFIRRQCGYSNYKKLFLRI